jgi:hypothetical protein
MKALKAGWVIILLLWSSILSPQEIAVPVRIQVPLFLRILSFDRQLKQHAGNEIVIGVVYQAKFRKSLNVKEEFRRVIEKSSVDRVEGTPLRCLPINLDEASDPADPASVIARTDVDILYVAPLRAVAIEAITAFSRENKKTTLTGVAEYVEAGLSVGIGAKGEEPLIIVNLSAARQEGADFSSQLLRLAKVID